MERIKSLITKYREQKKELTLEWRKEKEGIKKGLIEATLLVYERIIEDLEALFPEGLLHEPFACPKTGKSCDKIDTSDMSKPDCKGCDNGNNT